AKSRSLTVEARLTGHDARLRPGMFAQVRLILDRNAQIVMVPKDAVYVVAGLTKVFLLKNGKAVECRIPPGQQIENWVEAPSDMVRPGDDVIVSGVPQLTDGAPVRARS